MCARFYSKRRSILCGCAQRSRHCGSSFPYLPKALNPPTELICSRLRLGRATSGTGTPRCSILTVISSSGGECLNHVAANSDARICRDCLLWSCGCRLLVRGCLCLSCFLREALDGSRRLSVPKTPSVSRVDKKGNAPSRPSFHALNFHGYEADCRSAEVQEAKVCL